MSYLGSWKINDYITFPCNTHRADTGAASDADAAPTYRIYEDETATPIATGTMALLDAANTTGFYTEQIQLLAATGFEKGKTYTIYIEATVNAVVGTMSHTFQIEAEVDANVVSDKTGYDLNANQGAVTIGTVTTLTGHTPQTGDSYAVVTNGTYGLSAIETLVDDLESRLTTARAGYLDELAAANIPADIDTLLARLTTLRAGYLDNLSAGAVAQASVCTEARLAELDAANIPTDIANVKTDTGNLITRVPDTISLANINAQMDSALDTAIPGVPTADSINERIKAIDDKLPSGIISDFDETTNSVNLSAASEAQIDAIEVDTNSLNDTKITTGRANNLDNLDAAISTRSTITTVQVNAEVDTALVDVNLDHLVGTATGIPAVPAGTYLDQIMDDGVATYDRATDSLQAIADSGVVGANTVTISLKDTDAGGVIIPDVFITLRNNAGDTVLDRKTTDENGQVIFSLDDGSYKLYFKKLGSYTFTTPSALTVLGNTTAEYYGVPFSPSAPSLPNTCIVYGWIVGATGQATLNAAISATIVEPPQLSSEQQGISVSAVSTTTDANGYFEITLIQSKKYRLTISAISYSKNVVVPKQANANYSTL